MAVFEARVAATSGSRNRLVLSGELDVVARPTFDGVAAGLDLEDDITVDLTELTFIDSSGMLGLASLQRLAEAAGGSVRLVNADDRTLRLLRVTGLIDKFEVG